MKHCAVKIVSSLRLEKIPMCAPGRGKYQMDECECYRHNSEKNSMTCVFVNALPYVWECTCEEVVKELTLEDRLEQL